jgi:cellulose synthase/poly-beta-1,6-N-acetylglucosamine synthase-like glycosyltransferase
VDTGRGCNLLLTSPLAASQNFEYKMSNILDKPLEVRSPPVVDAAPRCCLIHDKLTFYSLSTNTRASSVISLFSLEPSVPTDTRRC